MRDIKSRVWDGEKYNYESNVQENDHCYMISLTGEVYDCAYGRYEDGAIDLIIEQYTGLNDINGKELCESDRIKEYDGYIVFQDGAFWVDHIHKYGRKQTLLLEWIRKRNKAKTFIEVIGNIHE